MNPDKFLQSYVIGVALGDGNLSNPNGRAVRLRVTCDKKYPKLLAHITKSLLALLPENRASFFEKPGCVDISIYSNQLPELIGYRWDAGSKIIQNVGVPAWIKSDVEYTKECLRGLFQTDGSIYVDRGYRMVNFINISTQLADDVFFMIKTLGYAPNMQKLNQTNRKIKHTIRLCKDADDFIKEIDLWKE